MNFNLTNKFGLLVLILIENPQSALRKNIDLARNIG